jgi:hypothetical protein
VKILHTYDDGTCKVLMDTGEVSLIRSVNGQPCLIQSVPEPSKSLELKIAIKTNGKTYTLPLCSGPPAQDEIEATWIKISGSTYSELIYKVLINAGMLCGRALGSVAQHFFISRIFAIKGAVIDEPTFR